MVDRQVSHHASQVRGLGPDLFTLGSAAHFHEGVVNDVFCLAAATRYPRGEPNQAVTMVKEHVKQLGAGPSQS
ncbi:hypothetical protein D3C71_2133410 [compost metagenome]